MTDISLLLKLADPDHVPMNLMEIMESIEDGGTVDRETVLQVARQCFALSMKYKALFTLIEKGYFLTTEPRENHGKVHEKLPNMPGLGEPAGG